MIFVVIFCKTKKRTKVSMAEKIRILIVDDSSLVRDLLTKALTAPEHELDLVGAAIHGQDALDKLQTLNVDVVVTDMEMPVMNGLDFIRAAMARHQLPIIVLSSWAHNDKNITLQALEAGAADFIPKPSALNPQGFQETLTRLVVKIKAAARIAGPRFTSSIPANTTVSSASSPIPRSASVFAPLPSVQPALQTQPMQAQAIAQPFVLSSPNYEERIPQLILGVGEIGAANEYGKIVKTFALGSCVALMLFSPTFDVVGMAHIALATSTTSPEKAHVLPGYFADTALPALINEMRAKGYRKPISQLLAKMTGGAQTGADTGNYFKIGEKNIAAIKTLLQTFGISLIGEDTGQSFSRTVFVQVGSKAVHVSSPEKKPWIV
jgi:chemotaxis protein CheD